MLVVPSGKAEAAWRSSRWAHHGTRVGQRAPFESASLLGLGADSHLRGHIKLARVVVAVAKQGQCCSAVRDVLQRSSVVGRIIATAFKHLERKACAPMACM